MAASTQFKPVTCPWGVSGVCTPVSRAHKHMGRNTRGGNWGAKESGLAGVTVSLDGFTLLLMEKVMEQKPQDFDLSSQRRQQIHQELNSRRLTGSATHLYLSMHTAVIIHSVSSQWNYLHL